MNRLAELTSIVQREVANYNQASGWRETGYYLPDARQGIYAIVLVPDADHPNAPKPVIMLMARVTGAKVVIHEDITDRPLYEELLRCGIPRDKIVLAYAGETLPEETPPTP